MPKLHSCLVFLLFIFAYIPQASGLLIDDPENVTYMKVSMTQSGHLRLHSLSSSAMAETLKRGLKDQNLRESLAVKGKERATLYTWEKTAKLTIDVMEEVLKR